MLKDKIALVTGASRGIGAATAVKMAEYGAFVVVNYNGSKDRAEAVVNEIKANGGDGVALQCDVSDFNACKEMIDNILKEYGRIDILVNNAGITKDGLLMAMSEEDFDKVITTNLKGAFNTIRHMSKQFLKQKSGHIVNLSSISGVNGNAGQANYAASKAGIVGLTKSVAKELASRGVTCNAVAPGFIETEMTEAMTDKAREAIMAEIPMKRGGKAEEVAELICYLSSDRASYVTGQVIGINGGLS